MDENYQIEIVNSTDKESREKYAKFLYEKLQRKEGLLERDCDRLVRNDRVIWGTCMVSCGDADALVTGNTRRYTSTLDKVKRVVDPRLISVIPVAVAKAAIKSGVARKKIENFEIYKDQLKQRLDPSTTIMQGINTQIKKSQKWVVFADGEDENTLKAAIAFKSNGLGTPVLIAKKKLLNKNLKKLVWMKTIN